MADQTVSLTTYEEPSFFSALLAVRRRRRKVDKAKRVAEEVNYLNIVAMMDMMTILMVFLLKSVSFATVNVAESSALSLPYSTTQVEPVEAVKVFVTKHAVVVEDRKVADIENGAIKPEYLDTRNRYLIPPLKALLDEQAEKLAAVKKANPNMKVQDNLAVMADKDTPYYAIMQVLYTASKATGGSAGNEMSFGTFRLTVLRREQ